MSDLTLEEAYELIEMQRKGLKSVYEVFESIPDVMKKSGLDGTTVEQARQFLENIKELSEL